MENKPQHIVIDGRGLRRQQHLPTPVARTYDRRRGPGAAPRGTVRPRWGTRHTTTGKIIWADQSIPASGESGPHVAEAVRRLAD